MIGVFKCPCVHVKTLFLGPFGTIIDIIAKILPANEN
jgi:hypothetical protein